MIPWSFFLLVLLLSIPVWVLGTVVGQVPREILPINLPLAALMTFNPLLAAALLTYREGGWEGVKRLLGRALDYPRIERKIWLVPVLGLMPLMAILAYGILRLVDAPLPAPHVPLLAAPAMLAAFAVGAAGEELGWQAYAFDRLPDRWSALAIAVAMGAVWGVWHAVPDIQAHRAPTWIFWQRLGAVGLRVLIVWIYLNTGRSVFAVILFHAMNNVSTYLFPNYGSHYDPFIACVLGTGMAGIVVFLWGAATLARFRMPRGMPPSLRSG